MNLSQQIKAYKQKGTRVPRDLIVNRIREILETIDKPNTYWLDKKKK